MSNKKMIDIIELCKRRGFFFQSCDLYGGIDGVWDYGPLGVEIKNNLKKSWWNSIVYERDDVEGLDASILSNDKLLDYTDHINSCFDLMVECKLCKSRMRADHIKYNQCNNCRSIELSTPRQFNMLFKTPIEDQKGTIWYLRPATAQHTFVNFKNVLDSTNRRLPFGIAQIGKAFRNEIAPSKFLFRMREFEQMELQFFIEPGEDQYWHDIWLNERLNWWTNQGICRDNIKVIDVPKKELAHYSKRTLDIYYCFPDDFEGEIEGIANRTDYDLGSHSKQQAKLNIISKVKENNESKDILAIHNQKNGEWLVPFVIEPAAGVDRGVMAIICEAYTLETMKNGKKRVVLKLKPHLAPFVTAIIISENNNLQMVQVARKIKRNLQALGLGRIIIEEENYNIYSKHDEIGTPICITIDSESIKDPIAVVIRYRDTMQQERMLESKLSDWLISIIRPSSNINEIGTG